MLYVQICDKKVDIKRVSGITFKVERLENPSIERLSVWIDVFLKMENLNFFRRSLEFLSIHI